MRSSQLKRRRWSVIFIFLMKSLALSVSQEVWSCVVFLNRYKRSDNTSFYKLLDGLISIKEGYSRPRFLNRQSAFSAYLTEPTPLVSFLRGCQLSPSSKLELSESYLYIKFSCSFSLKILSSMTCFKRRDASIASRYWDRPLIFEVWAFPASEAMWASNLPKQPADLVKHRSTLVPISLHASINWLTSLRGMPKLLVNSSESFNSERLGKWNLPKWLILLFTKKVDWKISQWLF